MQGAEVLQAEVGSQTVASFVALHGVVSVYSRDGQPSCEDMPFHWNGTELVICSIGTASWRKLEAVPVDVYLVAGNIRFQFPGNGSTDQVDGVAPEYREQLVTYLGPERGHQAADEAEAAGQTHRLFITPHWNADDSERADR